MVTQLTLTQSFQVRILMGLPIYSSCSLVVKHPAYTRHCLQIRERRWFESTREDQVNAGRSLCESTGRLQVSKIDGRIEKSNESLVANASELASVYREHKLTLLLETIQ